MCVAITNGKKNLGTFQETVLLPLLKVVQMKKQWFGFAVLKTRHTNLKGYGPT